MPHLPKWRRHLRFWRADIHADVDDELRFHFEARIADLRARGATSAEAQRMADDEFGDVNATRDQLHAIGERLERTRARARGWQIFRGDLAYVLRALRATPLFTAGVVLTFALGIGAASIMYGMMRRLLLEPPPHVVAPERVARLYFRYETRGDTARTVDALSYPFYEQLRTQARTLDAVAAYAPREPVVVGTGPEARRGRATLVSAGFWRVLGTRPVLGRFFTDDEAHPATGAPVVVLGHAFWRQRFGGDSAAVGSTLRVRGTPYRIVGIAPRGFRGVELEDTDVWLPMLARAGSPYTHDWYRYAGSVNTKIVVRRRADITPERAAAELSHEQATFMARPDAPGARPGTRSSVVLGSLRGALDRTGRRSIEATVTLWLVGVAVVLLAIACTNVASLLVLRALRRRREIAVRVALGMSRRRLAALLFVESATLALLGGGAAAIVIAIGGSRVRAALLPGMLGERADIDWGTTAFAVTAVVLTALLTGIVPVLQTRGASADALRDGAQHGATRRSRTYVALLVAQTALSATLLVGAGLFLRSLHRVTTMDLGYDTDRAFVVTVDFTGSGRESREVHGFFERALERVRALPGVQHASLATSAPFRGAQGLSVATTPGEHAGIEDAKTGTPMGALVADEYFDAVGMRIVQGRGFVAADRTGPPTIVINEALAQRGWPGRSPVGACAYRGDAECVRIVGVARNARLFSLTEDQRLVAFVPLDPAANDDRVLLVRVAPNMPDAPRVEAALRGALRQLDPALPYVDVQRLGDVLNPQLRPWRIGATVFTAFGALAALLAALGLYAAVAYAVTQRTREIGVRLALGAARPGVARLIVGDALRIAATGIAAGFALVLLGAGWIADLLFDTSPRDPAVLATVGLATLLVATMASLVPARRATRVNPTEALRAE